VTSVIPELSSVLFSAKKLAQEGISDVNVSSSATCVNGMTHLYFGINHIGNKKNVERDYGQ